MPPEKDQQDHETPAINPKKLFEQFVGQISHRITHPSNEESQEKEPELPLENTDENPS